MVNYFPIDSLFNRAVRVIDSCVTAMQVQVASKYCERVLAVEWGRMSVLEHGVMQGALMDAWNQKLRNIIELERGVG